MRIKLDENLPFRLAPALEAIGHDVHTVKAEGLRGADDRQLWERVQHENRFLITQDLDFSDTRLFIPGTHAGILLVRLPNPSRSQLHTFVLKLFKRTDINRWQGAYIVATLRKVRVLYAQGSASGTI